MMNLKFTVLALLALAPSAHADYLEASRAEALRYQQQRKAEESEKSRRDAAAREQIFSNLANSYATAHGGFRGEIKRYGYDQPLTNIMAPEIGSVQARLILTFSTGDGTECGIFLSLYQDKNGYRNSAILDCLNPTTGKTARKNVVLKSIRPTLI